MSHVLHVQQRSSTCAVAAVRTVLHHQFGLRISESALVALGTRPSRPIVKHGSTTTDMRRMVRGASTSYHTGSPWGLRTRRRGTFALLAKELRGGRWPIVQVYQQEQDEHHAVVVTALTATHVLVFDPDYSTTPNLRWLPRDEFAEWWKCPYSGETWFAVITGNRVEAL